MRNKILITIDSLRWDVLVAADAPFLKSLGTWKQAEAVATFTFPAHMAFFIGKLPQTTDDTDFYDATAFRTDPLSGTLQRNRQLWRLGNPLTSRDTLLTLEGKNIIEGFSKLGYRTIGTGSMNWFNPNLPAGVYLTESFDNYTFFPGENHRSYKSSQDQVSWALSEIGKSDQPFFLFINFGETHHPFVYNGAPWENDPTEPYGNFELCFQRQKRCLEHLDLAFRRLGPLLQDADFVICGDHGEAMGEDGLWGHGFEHLKVREVPMLVQTFESESL